MKSVLLTKAWLIALWMFVAAQSGCRRDVERTEKNVPASEHRASAGTSSNVPVDAPPTDAKVAQNRDHAHPPIDCPLRKQGIDPAHLKPFEEVEKYIAFLERPERADWQKPDEIIAALKLKGDETVADVGAGSGYFAFRFAKALPLGRVIAADVEPEMIRHMHHLVMTENVKNFEARVIEPDDPAIPKDVDLVIICDVLHHVSDRPAWLKKITAAMPRGARLALVEFKEGKLPQGPPEGMKIPRAELLRLMTDAGLTLRKDHENLLPYQIFLEFEKP